MSVLDDLLSKAADKINSGASFDKDAFKAEILAEAQTHYDALNAHITTIDDSEKTDADKLAEVYQAVTNFGGKLVGTTTTAGTDTPAPVAADAPAPPTS